MRESRQICLWSGPRNISTAMMYSFAQRSDTCVVDEPLYAHYLINSGTSDYHPGSAEVISEQENHGKDVVSQMLGNCEHPVYFYKHMAHHLVGLDLSFLSKTTNIILTREPSEMISSYVKVIPEAEIKDLGYQQQLDLIHRLIKLGQNPIVIDSKSVLQNPAFSLIRICNAIEIPFEECMLQWPAGPIKEDGVWAKYWYKAVHESTGFIAYKKKQDEFPKQYLSLLEESNKLYNQILEYNILT